MTSSTLDRRRNMFRPDLAAESLRGKVEAERFAEGVRYQMIWPAVAMRAEPKAEAGFDTEMVFGETIAVLDVKDGWAWGQLDRDGYVGYVPADALSLNVIENTHRVAAVGTFLYATDDIKTPPLMHLSLNARLAVAETGERMCRLATGGWVVTRHIAPKDKFARDFVEIAERLICTPYLWGGRTRVGVDCSGLIQLAMEAAGLTCPRDSDMQRDEVGADVLVPAELDGLERGDLIFWRGHVGVMSDGVMLVHANAHHMAVVTEPLITAAKRIERTGGEIVAIKRPDSLSATAA